MRIGAVRRAPMMKQIRVGVSHKKSDWFVVAMKWGNSHGAKGPEYVRS